MGEICNFEGVGRRFILGMAIAPGCTKNYIQIRMLRKQKDTEKSAFHYYQDLLKGTL